MPVDIANMNQILREGTPEERRQFVKSSPDNSFKEATLGLLQTDSPEYVIIAMAPMAMEYCNGRNPGFGAPMAFVLHRYAYEIFSSGRHTVLNATTLTNLASQYLNALNLLGRSEKVLEFTGQYLSYYESIQEHQNLPSLKVAKATALINLNRIDEAGEVLADPSIEGNFAADIEVKRLREKIRALKENITRTASQSQKPQDAVTGGDLLNTLKKALGTFTDDPERLKALLSAAENLDPQNCLDVNTPEGFQQILDILKRGEDFITKGSGEQNEWTMKQKVREASQIFTFSQSPPEALIRQSMTALKSALRWAVENNHTELQNDSLWGLYLCFSRLNMPSEAADQLLGMRDNMEKLRTNIRNPIERGGVFSGYQYLFHAMVEKLHQAGRTGEMLEAIESSKGRGIADILTLKSGSVVADTDIYASVRQLPELTRQFNFHYITYFVDDDRTYAVLVSKTGAIHPVGPVEISKNTISESSRHVDPSEWGEPDFTDPTIAIPDASEAMSPLVECLAPLHKQGVIEEGDHICYSADENFNNVPLHYLQLNGKPLIETCTVSKIQTAFHLVQVLKKPGDHRPKEFISFIVPLQQDVESARWDKMKNSLERPAKWLSEQFEGTIYKNTDAGIGRLQNRLLHGRVIQFSTHGIFPTHEEMDQSNPFHHSGIVLSDGNSLPDANLIGRGSLDSVLTPEKIMDLELNFDDSHISLMACVSGLSREGIGGDALGMEWAFIQAGASSILSSNWYVSAELAAEFYTLFYRYWLIENETRASAFANAIKELQTQKQLISHPLDWAVFSLTGDWR